MIDRIKNQDVIEMTKNIKKSRDIFSKYIKMNRRYGKIFQKISKNNEMKVNIKPETPLVDDEIKKRLINIIKKGIFTKILCMANPKPKRRRTLGYKTKKHSMNIKISNNTNILQVSDDNKAFERAMTTEELNLKEKRKSYMPKSSDNLEVSLDSDDNDASISLSYSSSLSMNSNHGEGDEEKDKEIRKIK